MSTSLELVDSLYYISSQDKRHQFNKRYKEIKSKLTFYKALNFTDDPIIDNAFKNSIVQELCLFVEIVKGSDDKDLKVFESLKLPEVVELGKSEFFEKLTTALESFWKLKTMPAV